MDATCDWLRCCRAEGDQRQLYFEEAAGVCRREDVCPISRRCENVEIACPYAEEY